MKFVTARFDEGAKIRRLYRKILCEVKIKFVTHAVFAALSTGLSEQLGSSLKVCIQRDLLTSTGCYLGAQVI